MPRSGTTHRTMIAAIILLIVLLVLLVSYQEFTQVRRPRALGSMGVGIASWYGREYYGKPMANGKPFDHFALTFACWELPFGTVVEFEYGGRTVRATCTDRGPARRLNRNFDLSAEAFSRLTNNQLSLGVIPVRYRIIEPCRETQTSTFAPSL